VYHLLSPSTGQLYVLREVDLCICRTKSEDVRLGGLLTTCFEVLLYSFWINFLMLTPVFWFGKFWVHRSGYLSRGRHNHSVFENLKVRTTTSFVKDAVQKLHLFSRSKNDNFRSRVGMTYSYRPSASTLLLCIKQWSYLLNFVLFVSVRQGA
jgi:hypothetical protein